MIFLYCFLHGIEGWGVCSLPSHPGGEQNVDLSQGRQRILTGGFSVPAIWSGRIHGAHSPPPHVRSLAACFSHHSLRQSLSWSRANLKGRFHPKVSNHVDRHVLGRGVFTLTSINWAGVPWSPLAPMPSSVPHLLSANYRGCVRN